jgi:hypothetical protein
LGDFERVRKTRPRVVVGKDKDLGLAGEPTKSTRVQDSVAIALEAGTKLVRLFFVDAIAAPFASRGSRRHERVRELLTLV